VGNTPFEDFLESTFSSEDSWWGELAGCLLAIVAIATAPIWFFPATIYFVFFSRS